MVNTIGKMGVFIKEILAMELDMDSEYGRIIIRYIKDITNWIKRRDMEYIYGNKKKCIRADLKRIIDKDMEKYMFLVDKLNSLSFFIKGVGLRVINVLVCR